MLLAYFLDYTILLRDRAHPDPRAVMSLSDEFDSPADLAKLLVERFEGTDDTAEEFLQLTLAELRAQEKGDGGDGGGDGGTPSPTIQRIIHRTDDPVLPSQKKKKRAIIVSPAAEEPAENSLVAEEHNFTLQQLEMIKAKTMFNMIEPIDGGAKRLLFLSNSQATLLASDEAHLAKLLEALDVGKPQLVINLLTSGGFRGHTTRYATEHDLQKVSHSDMAGIKHNRCVNPNARPNPNPHPHPHPHTLTPSHPHPHPVTFTPPPSPSPSPSPLPLPSPIPSPSHPPSSPSP